MIDLKPVIARLKAEGMANVEGVTGLARIASHPPQYFPAVYVAPEAERGETPERVASQNAGIFDQRVGSRFTVVLFVGGSAANMEIGRAHV